jgi:membrane-associated phospholipid phosphatase
MSARAPVDRWRAVCLGSAALVLLVTAAVLVAGVLPGELVLRRAVLDRASPQAIDLARQVNLGGTWRILVPAALLLLVGCPPARSRWWLWGATLVLTPLVGEGWQELVGRPRPVGTALGFPSGHATATATFAVVTIYLVERTRLRVASRRVAELLPVLGAIAVGSARLILGAHWPADILGGFALGAACAAAAAWWDAGHPAPRGRSTVRAPEAATRDATLTGRREAAGR